MIVYFTFNDSPSGIFSSQVIDVVKYLRTISNENVKLISLVSSRNFFSNRKKIKEELADAIVLPMFPGVQNWKWNVFILYLFNIFYKPSVIISRGVFACNLSLKIKTKKNKVIYDGRGAISAEWREYNIGFQKLIHSIEHIEKLAVLNSDYRISVSQKLVQFWKGEFGYQLNSHVVIPCTLNSQYENLHFDQTENKKTRQELNFTDNDIILVYSGSDAGWQSFNILIDYLRKQLNNDVRCKVLFLSNENNQIKELKLQFPSRIKVLKVDVKSVPKYLMACDYGLLIREDSVTNSVASPVKFAEYLACGLPVIISDNIGDYSEFVHSKNCGFIYKSSFITNFNSDELREIAKCYFSKSNYSSEFNKILTLN